MPVCFCRPIANAIKNLTIFSGINSPARTRRNFATGDLIATVRAATRRFVGNFFSLNIETWRGKNSISKFYSPRVRKFYLRLPNLSRQTSITVCMCVFIREEKYREFFFLFFSFHRSEINICFVRIASKFVAKRTEWSVIRRGSIACSLILTSFFSEWTSPNFIEIIGTLCV